MKGFVRIDSRYWDTVIREYSSWTAAWIREAAQNSLDAGATEIAITTDRVNVKGDDPARFRVVWKDNGCGMTKEVLVNKFLALGGTGKDFKDGAVGGMGVAKSLLCFAQESYTLRSKGYEMTGVGDAFEIRDIENDDFVGVTLDVVLRSDLVLSYFERSLRLFFKLSQPKRNDIKIIYDGKELAWGQWKGFEKVVDGLGKFTLIKRSDLGEDDTCWYEKFGLDFGNFLAVRINGQLMHVTWKDLPGHIVFLDLEKPDQLNANRDSLKWTCSNQLEKVLAELVDNPKKFKRNDEGDKKILIGSRGLLSGRERAAATRSVSGRSDLKIDLDFYDVLLVNREKGGHLSWADHKNLLERWARAIRKILQKYDKDLSTGIGLVVDADVMAEAHNYNRRQWLLINPYRFVLKDDQDLVKELHGWTWSDLVVTAAHEIAHLTFMDHSDLWAGEFTRILRMLGLVGTGTLGGMTLEEVDKIRS